MAYVIALLVSILTMYMGVLTNQFNRIYEERLDRRYVSTVSDAARLVNNFFLINKRYPSNLNELNNFASSFGENNVASELRYIFVPTVVGTQYQYQRAILYIQNPSNVLDETEFQSLNTCGVGLDDDAGYCADNDAWYTVLDSSASTQYEIRMMNIRINETFFKLTQTYDGRNGGFPSKKNNGVTIPVNTSATLPDIVGYTGTSAACSGIFNFSKMYFNCSDLFDAQGNPVIYYFKSSREVYLIVRTSFRDTSGNSISISRYVKV